MQESDREILPTRERIKGLLMIVLLATSLASTAAMGVRLQFGPSAHLEKLPMGETGPRSSANQRAGEAMR
jgi:hypothetical protein